MKAIVLAAGKGTRMRHLTTQTPKPLLKVGGKTFLDHIFEALPKEVDEVIVVVGYQAQKIRAHLGARHKGKRVTYLVQKKLDGTARPVLAAAKHFPNKKERFFVIYGDEPVRKSEVRTCLKKEFAWLCIEVEKPEQSGIVTLSKTGRILNVVEKPKHPKSNLSVAGLMLVNGDIFGYKPVKHGSGEYYLTSLMNTFIKHHEVYAVWGRKFVSFSTPEDIKKFGKKL